MASATSRRTSSLSLTAFRSDLLTSNIHGIQFAEATGCSLQLELLGKFRSRVYLFWQTVGKNLHVWELTSAVLAWGQLVGNVSVKQTPSVLIALATEADRANCLRGFGNVWKGSQMSRIMNNEVKGKLVLKIFDFSSNGKRTSRQQRQSKKCVFVCVFLQFVSLQESEPAENSLHWFPVCGLFKSELSSLAGQSSAGWPCWVQEKLLGASHPLYRHCPGVHSNVLQRVHREETLVTKTNEDISAVEGHLKVIQDLTYDSFSSFF